MSEYPSLHAAQATDRCIRNQLTDAKDTGIFAALGFPSMTAYLAHIAKTVETA